MERVLHWLRQFGELMRKGARAVRAFAPVVLPGLRQFGELLRKEARDVRGIALGVLAAVALAMVGMNAVWDVEPGALDAARRQIWLALAAVALMPVLAEVFGAGESARWARMLPVRTWALFAARALLVMLYAASALLVAAVADLVSCHLVHGKEGLDEITVRSLTVTPLQDARFGVSVLALSIVAAAATVTRHAVASVVLGLSVIAWCALCFVPDHAPAPDESLQLPLLWTRAVFVPLASSGFVVASVLVALACAFAVRGPRERSMVHRSAAVSLGAAAVASATFAMAHDPFAGDAQELFAGQDAHLRRVDPTEDGDTVAVTLNHTDGLPRSTVWVIDTRTGERARVLAPEAAGFGALAGLIDVESPRWTPVEQRIQASYGRWVEGGPNSAPTGELVFDDTTGRTGRLGTPGFEKEPTTYVWRGTRIGEPQDDGLVRQRWSCEGRDREVEIVRQYLAPWVAPGARHRVFYADAERRIRLLDLEAGTDVETGLDLESNKTRLKLSRHQERWIIVRPEDRDNLLYDLESRREIWIPTNCTWTWTRRPETPILLGLTSRRGPARTTWSLLNLEDRVELEFEHDVDHVQDLDGERWLGTNHRTGAVHVFRADGRALVELRAGSIE